MPIQNAIEKINAQMQKDPNNTHLEVVGHYIIDRCTDEKTANAILNSNKALNDVMETIKAKAHKVAVNNVAMLVDTDVYRIIDKIYGFSQPLAQPEKMQSSKNEINIDFASFL